MRLATLIPLKIAGLGLLAACSTVPDTPQQGVNVDVPPLRTCVPMSALTRVHIPAKTETYIAITEIENPPYEPIQNRQEMTRIIEEARTIFVDSEGREITDVCDAQINPSGMTSEGSL